MLCGNGDPPGMPHDGTHCWNPRQVTKGNTERVFGRTQSLPGSVLTAWDATHISPHVSSQAGCNLSSVRSKVPRDPSRVEGSVGGWMGPDDMLVFSACIPNKNTDEA